MKLERKRLTFFTKSHISLPPFDIELHFEYICTSSAAVFVNHCVKSQFPRSSSGFCETFAGNGGSDPGQAEESHAAQVEDSASYFLDLNSNGDVVTRALADLNLSNSIELLSGGQYGEDNQHSMISCDTTELLRTPSPCEVQFDQEAEPVETKEAAVVPRNGSTEELQKEPCEQEQWAALSTIHNGKSAEFPVQMTGGIQSVRDTPATSTPKKQKVNGHTLSSDATEILEGRFEGSAYHRDGTRVGRYSLLF